jgi:predicted MPP superfamily phosphohydrolase
MKHLVKRVNALNPDIIFLTGDLMDGSLKQLKKEIEPLKHLKAKIDIIYITGNHEYYSGPISELNTRVSDMVKINALPDATGHYILATAT